MKQKEIIEGNKLIAEFMGFIRCFPNLEVKDTYQDFSQLYRYAVIAKNSVFHPCLNSGTASNGVNVDRYPEQMFFHTSWDWIMPVVEKVESLTNNFKDDGIRFQVDIKSKYVWNTTTKNNDFIYSCGIVRNQYQFIYNLGFTKLEAVYKTIIDFILWYNQKTQSLEK